MITPNRIGVLALTFVGSAFLAVGVETAGAAFNEKRVERDATGFYKGRTTNGVNQYKTNGVVTFTGMPEDGEGKMRIPVKDGKLKTKLVDEALPAANDKAIFKGREKKSAVRRNGKKIAVVANGNSNDGVHDPINGKVRGSLTDRGSKWAAKVKLSGERVSSTNPANSNSYKADAKGKS